jgi:monoamine oxidase
MLDLAIIGGGLAGLSLAQRLTEGDRRIAVFEARDRCGGRIDSPAVAQDFHCDLGPSWIWPDFQPRITAFLERYQLDVYPQWTRGHSLYQSERTSPAQVYLDEHTYAPARRIQGGTYRLIEVLVQALPSSLLKLNHRLREVIDRRDHVELRFDYQSTSLSVEAKQVVITIPPRLLVSSVAFQPVLDVPLRELMHTTPTWMAGHAKAVVRYHHPFWREAGLSGSALARYPGAALAEIFDASSNDGTHALLSGFFALPAVLRRQYRDDLEALLLEQLVRLFGKEAAQPQSILIRDWCDEPFTAASEDEQPPAGHPQYGHVWLQRGHWNDKLYFSGTETATEFGGYLEGALEATERVATAILM